ncbi:hypothetical protein [Streptacidiphilus melanogenes]|uniref:hypothetical protein n=1 Tax=Streptacidiphilus melanogenes TaxID=411235 RepID=UPI000A9C9772|nr:hypothetical protein [Streptacidiphilus melanogenes]
MSINRQVSTNRHVSRRPPDGGASCGGPAPYLELPGPTVQRLERHERIDRHHHDRHQLIHPGSGVLQVETAAGSWVVPPQRAV